MYALNLLPRDKTLKISHQTKSVYIGRPENKALLVRHDVITKLYHALVYVQIQAHQPQSVSNSNVRPKRL